LFRSLLVFSKSSEAVNYCEIVKTWRNCIVVKAFFASLNHPREYDWFFVTFLFNIGFNKCNDFVSVGLVGLIAVGFKINRQTVVSPFLACPTNFHYCITDILNLLSLLIKD
jgi:hypothetical protein